MVQEPSRCYQSWQLAAAELQGVFEALPTDTYERFFTHFSITGPGRYFFTGQGRSGLCAQMAAMRFMQLGLRTHVVGEPTAPSVRRGDTLVIVSGSGGTPVNVGFAQIAKEERARVLLITHQAQSPLRDLADGFIVLPANRSRQFGGTLFEQSALVLLDSVVQELTTSRPDRDAMMRHNHANLQ